MNSKSTYIKVRITPELKSEVQEILTELGTTLSDAITLFLSAVKRKRGIPFKATLPKWYVQYDQAPLSKNEGGKQTTKRVAVKKYKDAKELFTSLGIPSV